jgi:uncharacterized protein (TIGR02453 family)
MPAPDFTGFTDTTLDFLSGLKANNRKDWFDEHRKTYETSVRKPARAFAELMAGELESLTGEPQKPKLFRINRDIRFSKDKTPYNPHVHISWLPAGPPGSPPAFMFGLSPDYCTVGCGVFEFSKPALESYRKAVAGPRGDDLGIMIEGLKKEEFRLSEPALKRVPPGFPADHPWAELSLHKGIAVWFDFDAPNSATQPDIMARCLERYERLLPLRRFLAGLG